VLTWSPRRPPAYRIDFLDLDAPMAPGIVLRGPLDPSGLQIASHVPYGTGIFPAGPGSPESTTLVIDFDDPAAVSVYATQATPRGIAIAARPASGTRPAPTPPYGDSGRSICFALPWVRVDTTRLLLLSRG
jgi:hypothetical protein